MLYLNRVILINALLLLTAAVLHIQQVGYLDCEAAHTCNQTQSDADFGLTILGALMLLGFFNCYRSDWAKKDLIFLGLAAAATLFAVKSYMSEPSMERYISSILIYIEIATMIFALVSLATIIVWPWLIYKKNWRGLRDHTLAIFAAIFCLGCAFYVDAPTLIYAT
jgi:hypothetical protein